jgi:hypothetical protein
MLRPETTPPTPLPELVEGRGDGGVVLRDLTIEEHSPITGFIFHSEDVVKIWFLSVNCFRLI